MSFFFLLLFWDELVLIFLYLGLSGAILFALADVVAVLYSFYWINEEIKNNKKQAEKQAALLANHTYSKRLMVDNGPAYDHRDECLWLLQQSGWEAEKCPVADAVIAARSGVEVLIFCIKHSSGSNQARPLIARVNRIIARNNMANCKKLIIATNNPVSATDRTMARNKGMVLMHHNELLQL